MDVREAFGGEANLPALKIMERHGGLAHVGARGVAGAGAAEGDEGVEDFGNIMRVGTGETFREIGYIETGGGIVGESLTVPRRVP